MNNDPLQEERLKKKIIDLAEGKNEADNQVEQQQAPKVKKRLKHSQRSPAANTRNHSVKAHA